MVRGYLIAALGALPLLVPSMPGSVVQKQTVYFTGEGMSSRWTIAASRSVLGREAGGTPAYQWYLSIYAPPQGDTARRVLRSPGNSDLVPRVEKARGAQLYFPREDVKIVGGAELERPTVQDAVILTHVAGADCGTATITVLGADTRGNIRQRVQISNYCALEAHIVRDGALQAVRIAGPYYAANSPVCCPARPHVTALLRYRDGRWQLKPNVFRLAR